MILGIILLMRKKEEIENFKKSFTLMLSAGSKFECYAENDHESWYDAVTGDIAGMSSDWAEEHLKNIKTLTVRGYKIMSEIEMEFNKFMILMKEVTENLKKMNAAQSHMRWQFNEPKEYIDFVAAMDEATNGWISSHC